MFRESFCEKMCSGTVGCETACSGRFCSDQVCSGRGGFAKCIPGGMALRERVPGRCSGNIDSKLKSKMQSTMKMSVELPAVASCHFKRGRPILRFFSNLLYASESVSMVLCLTGSVSGRFP